MDESEKKYAQAGYDSAQTLVARKVWLEKDLKLRVKGISPEEFYAEKVEGGTHEKSD